MEQQSVENGVAKTELPSGGPAAGRGISASVGHTHL